MTPTTSPISQNSTSAQAKQRSQSDKPCPTRSEQRRNSEKGLSKTEKSTHLAKVSAEDERLFAALDRMRASFQIKSEDVSDRILCQAGSAMLRHWQSKDTSEGEKLVTAANALAEMQPANATELMLAAQMLAVNDAIFLFMSQATLGDTSLEKRDFYTEKASSLMSLFVQQADCMMRLKGMTGRQRVTVEHVHVHSGGQAIVGTVTGGESDKGGRGWRKKSLEHPMSSDADG